MEREAEANLQRGLFLKEELERAQDRLDQWNYFSIPAYGSWMSNKAIEKYFHLQKIHRDRTPYEDVYHLLRLESAKVGKRE